jgi:hypothetical protein
MAGCRRSEGSDEASSAMAVAASRRMAACLGYRSAVSNPLRSERAFNLATFGAPNIPMLSLNHGCTGMSNQKEAEKDDYYPIFAGSCTIDQEIFCRLSCFLGKPGE